ncbi:MAG: T9SS type A sorting domain-containing protein [Candidatus Symbiothrix sp.]|jgi:hypothetical protein|nr:T9SS type A sorting domain-containing protein [Candidatus Symbiothrix sp.]
MKKNSLVLAFLLVCCVTQAQTALVDEEFNDAPDGNRFGAFSLNNYQTDIADWSYEIDNFAKISGDNSLYLNIFNSGTEWWALQVRTDEFPGQTWKDVFEVSFKAASSVATAFDFKAEGEMNFNYRVELPGAETVRDFKFRTAPMDRDGFIVFFFALGTAPAGEYWFDAFKVVKVDESAIASPETDAFDVYCFDGRLFVHPENPVNNAKIKVFNVLGQEVAKANISGEKTDLPLGKGIYLVSVTDESGKTAAVKKVINQ